MAIAISKAAQAPPPSEPKVALKKQSGASQKPQTPAPKPQPVAQDTVQLSGAAKSAATVAAAGGKK